MSSIGFAETCYHQVSYAADHASALIPTTYRHRSRFSCRADHQSRKPFVLKIDVHDSLQRDSVGDKTLHPLIGHERLASPAHPLHDCRCTKFLHVLQPLSGPIRRRHPAAFRFERCFCMADLLIPRNSTISCCVAPGIFPIKSTIRSTVF